MVRWHIFLKDNETNKAFEVNVFAETVVNI